MGIKDDVLGYWDYRTPFYPIFHEDNKTITLQLQNAKNYYAPIFEAGRFTETNGIIKIPLSITVNRATVDGYR